MTPGRRRRASWIPRATAMLALTAGTVTGVHALKGARTTERANEALIQRHVPVREIHKILEWSDLQTWTPDQLDRRLLTIAGARKKDAERVDQERAQKALHGISLSSRADVIETLAKVPAPIVREAIRFIYWAAPAQQQKIEDQVSALRGEAQSYFEARARRAEGRARVRAMEWFTYFGAAPAAAVLLAAWMLNRGKRSPKRFDSRK